MSNRYLIVGLGNPGRKYANTRHNIGFMVIDELARRYAITKFKNERRAAVGDGMISEKRVMLVKPQTYMNRSGQAVRALLDFYKLEPADLLVIHDHLDIPLGTLRIRSGGGAGGQNGIKDIINHLGTQEFARIRCGISRPPGSMNAADYVLQPFTKDEAITAERVIDRAADAVESWLTVGLDNTMNRYNGSVDQPADTNASSTDEN